MDLLGRYYTQTIFSNLLVSQISVDHPKRILELGAGEGSLLKAATDRWLNAQFIATDIDRKSVENISRSLPHVNIFHVNSLSAKLDQKLKINVGSIDVAICNPPYLKIKSQKSFLPLFSDASLNCFSSLQLLTSDIIFLAQNLALLKNQGELGIILPDSIITGLEFLPLRKALLENHRITKIIQLPEDIFPRTEALTHILFIKKGSSTSSSVNLYSSDKLGRCEKCIEVNSNLLVNRMDFKYHSYNARKSRKSGLALSHFTSEIVRGNIENKELRSLNVSQLHTTSLIHGSSLKFSKSIPWAYRRKYRIAKAGDILLARVGRGCIGKVSIVEKGSAIFSDCVYRIRVPEENRMSIFAAFQSLEGQNWFNALSHGVCAKVLSKRDLLNFPL